MADVQYPAPAIGNGGQGPQPVARPAAHAEIPPAGGQGLEGVQQLADHAVLVVHSRQLNELFKKASQ